jgi:hypothetical protein
MMIISVWLTILRHDEYGRLGLNQSNEEQSEKKREANKGVLSS